MQLRVLGHLSPPAACLAWTKLLPLAQQPAPVSHTPSWCAQPAKQSHGQNRPPVRGQTKRRGQETFPPATFPPVFGCVQEMSPPPASFQNRSGAGDRLRQ